MAYRFLLKNGGERVIVAGSIYEAIGCLGEHFVKVEREKIYQDED